MIVGKNIEEFSKYNFLYIENILDGIEKFKHICFTADYKNYNLFIKIIANKSKKSFFDFYFSNLNENEKQAFYNLENYDNIIKRFKFNKEDIFFDLKDIDDEIFNFITKISYKEILFSTFYFDNPNITLWTNYNKQFILFFKDEQFILECKKIAKDLNLEILFEKC